MKRDYFILAVKNLRHRKIRSWLTILGIFIGIAAVVSLISLGTGMREAIVGQFGSLGADKLMIQNAGTGFGPPGSTSVNKLTEHDLKLIKTADNIEEVISRLIRMVKVEYGKELIFSYIGSMPDNKKQMEIIYDTFNAGVYSGRLLEQGDKGKVVLGNDFLNYFEKEIKAGDNLKIQGENFEVAGILEKSSNFQMNMVVLMMEDDLKRILNIGNEIDLIVVQVTSKDKTEETAKQIEDKLRKDRNEDIGEEDFSVQTPVQAIENVNLILNIINLIVSGIAAISLLVGGIGIANTMYTSVLERTKEIGVMKAIGAKNKDVLLIFLIESGLLGLVGGFIGAGIGLGFAFGVAKIASLALNGFDLKIQVSLPLVLGAIAFSVCVGTLAGILPARQASKLKVVEALRG